MPEPEDIWEKVKNNLKQKNINNHFLHTWLEPAKILKIEKNEISHAFLISVPSELHKYWISQNLVELISSEISALHKNPFKVQLIVKKELKSQKKPFPKEDASLSAHQMLYQKTFSSSSTSPLNENNLPHSLSNQFKHSPPHSSSSLKRDGKLKPFNQSKKKTKLPEGLNPYYTFSHFIVGRNNEFAQAASLHIAENPKPKLTESYNPFFIYGPTGMGKTHLLHAIGNHIRKHHPNLRINYISSEYFLNEFISGIRRGEMDQFRKKYRDSCDILLMDDVQVLRHGESSQEEFFHTLNHFFMNGKQIAFASDKMPKDMKGLKDRIRTRLEWGLIADIKVPDMDTRTAILKYKAETMKMTLPEEVILYLARISKHSVRELEGHLNKVKMFSELQDTKIDLHCAKKLFSSHDTTSSIITAQEIQKITAQHYKVKVSDLKSKLRTQPFVQARQASMFFIKKYLNKSLAEIGKMFGKKDHTTVLNAIKKIEALQSKNPTIKKDLEKIENAIHLVNET